MIEKVKAEVKTAGTSRGRTGSIESAANASGSTNIQSNVDTKIDWLIKTVREIRDEVACKSEIKTIIKQIIREELENFKKELEDVKRTIQEKITEIAENEIKSYSEAVKDKKKESKLIVKPKTEQESEATKKLVKEKVDIKNLAVGITKIKKGGKRSIILGCESEKEIKMLKDTVREKLGDDFKIEEPEKRKPKIKIINVNEEEINLKDENLIDTIVKQNEINGKEEDFYITVVKKIVKEKKDDIARTREGGRREEGSLILEVDETTHERMIRKEKLNIGWRKCLVFDYFNVKRCFKCWGYYHIAKNCTRQEIIKQMNIRQQRRGV